MDELNNLIFESWLSGNHSCLKITGYTPHYDSNVNILTKGKKKLDYLPHPETLNFIENMTLNDLSCESKSTIILLGHIILAFFSFFFHFRVLMG